ncbi:hypothetical protein HMPREF9120_00136 [Neisseria sp. oral taxon 020 str. F0370]|nr:hypothetical protein HMPREF9120_00136 [Neisseria sp. oral taxon 020 str. F0370]
MAGQAGRLRPSENLCMQGFRWPSGGWRISHGTRASFGQHPYL